MRDDQKARRVYSTEELYRLRASCSAPKLHESIEEHDRENAELVKEHVLRGSRSFAARSFRSRTALNGLRVPSNKSNNENIQAGSTAHSTESFDETGHAVLGEIANNHQMLRPGPNRFRPSPTPSLKRKKAEAIVKAHGSPTHVRVTAGGRIVPSDQSPLCLPRFGYSAIKANGGLIKFAPNHPIGKAAQWTQTVQDGTQDGFVAQDIEGRLCQIINGTILPLTEVDGALRLYMPAPNLNITHRGPSYGQPLHTSDLVAANDDTVSITQREASQPSIAPPVQPSIATQTNALELEYSKLEHELKDLDKTEVIHGKTMSKPAKDALVSKRRELVITMDNVRKALKSLRDAPQPRIVQSRPQPSPEHTVRSDSISLSPRISRPPSYLQRVRQVQSINSGTHHQAPSAPFPPAYPAPVYGLPSSFPMAPAFPYQPMPMADGNYAMPPFSMPPHGMYMQPPPFDGSMTVASPFQVYQDLSVQGASTQSVSAAKQSTSETNVPQNDGAASIVDHRVSPPRQSHALPVKDPETKKIVSVRSLLNPMSPVYKPAGSRPGTNLTSSQDMTQAESASTTSLDRSRPALGHAVPTASQIDGRTSKTATGVVINSDSSVSSIKTADFFPRNTRDYSMRKHEYPPLDDSDDKENEVPHFGRRGSSDDSITTSGNDRHNTDWNPELPHGVFAKYSSPQTKGYRAPAAPPGTPVTNSTQERHPQFSLKVDGSDWEHRHSRCNPGQVPDRQAHNLSPKSKRHWQFIEERPGQDFPHDALSDTSFEARNTSRVSIGAAAFLDFSNKPREWIEGYQAGLHRRTVGADRMGEYLDGYCSGLLKSKPAVIENSTDSTGSPVKPSSRRASAVQQHGSSGSYHSQLLGDFLQRPTIETSTQNVDTFKQAVFAPQNEHAILTPALDGPSIEETSFDLGAWQRHHELMMKSRGEGLASFPYPERNSSISRSHTHPFQPMPDERRGSLALSRQPTHDSGIAPFAYAATPKPVLTPSAPLKHSSASASGDRIGSITSIDTGVHRPWQAGPVSQRIFSPFEWKSGSSVAQSGHLASGFSAQAPFDSNHFSLWSENTSMLSNAADIEVSPNIHEVASRFREASLDGLSSPVSPGPMSPVLSPQVSPRTTPVKIRRDKSGLKKESPGKTPSPAKAKFEHIASKVGIKPSGERKDTEGEPVSPQSKHRWRDL